MTGLELESILDDVRISDFKICDLAHKLESKAKVFHDHKLYYHAIMYYDAASALYIELGYEKDAERAKQKGRLIQLDSIIDNLY